MSKPVPHRMEMPVVGLDHRVSASTRRILEEAVKRGPISVRLQREPDNIRDKNAIMVVLDQAPYKHMHIGYIPRTSAALLGPAVDSGQISELSGKITDIDAQMGTAIMLFEFKGAVKMKVQASS